MKGMGHQHPGFPRTPKEDNPRGYAKQGKSPMDHGHKNYTKDKRSGAPSSSALDKPAAAAGNSGERKRGGY